LLIRINIAPVAIFCTAISTQQNLYRSNFVWIAEVFGSWLTSGLVHFREKLKKFG